MTYSPCPSCKKLNRIPHAGVPICGNCKSELHIKNGINELNTEELKVLIAKSPLPVVTDFWAPWCVPCRLFAPTFEQGAKALDGQAVFAKVNTESHPEAGAAYQVRGIPTLVIFKEGRESARQSGAIPLPQLLQWVRSV